MAVSCVVEIFVKDPKSWRQMDPRWRLPMIRRCQRSVGRSSCKRKKPSFWDAEPFFFQNAICNQWIACFVKVFACHKKAPKKSTEGRLNLSEQIRARNCTDARRTHVEHFDYLCSIATYCNAIFFPLSSRIIKRLAVICKWCMQCRFSQLGGRNTRGCRSRQITAWSSWLMRGRRDRCLNGGQRNRVSTSRLQTLKDWIPFQFRALRES